MWGASAPSPPCLYYTVLNQIDTLMEPYVCTKLGECMALWGKPNELSIEHHVYI